MFRRLKLMLFFGVISMMMASCCCSAQRFFGLKYCRKAESCVPIRSCPRLFSLVRSDARRVRNSICGFRNRISYVCCPQRLRGRKPSLLPENCGRPATDDKIIGGEVAPIGAYPWMAAIGYTEPGNSKPEFSCAGSIINSRYVLTAAHCVHRELLGRRRIARIHLGDWDLETSQDCESTIFGDKCNPPHIETGYEEIILHPDYTPLERAADIALIRLSNNLDFKNDPTIIQPICLPNSEFDPRSAKDNPIAAGWGMTDGHPSSNVLLRVKLPFANESLCRKRYPLHYVQKQLCVGGIKEEDTCKGDSGGPLIMSREFGPPFTQIGIVSFGSDPCGLLNFPGVYTSVKDYVDWIKGSLRP